MLDLWGFLLQTLCASGVAALILLVKAVFKDKLPPKWQFAVWGVLGIAVLLPAGLGGRYTLVHWQLVVEIIKSWVGDFSLTRVLFPFPVMTAVPNTVPGWLFALYVLGVVTCLVKYTVSYWGLRNFARMGSELSGESLERIRAMAARQKVRLRRVVTVDGLPGAFVCGVFRPVLVLPAQKEPDGKILLHELFHLKNKDTLWSMMICVLRSIHWCNPLLVCCANRALNDLESRCDQQVLEQLEGEERRAYGYLLLSMANEQYAKTPGSTCIHNGGKNIRERIENIARFKKYPQGMKLVSVCVLILLLLPVITGTQAAAFFGFKDSVIMTFGSARSTVCTTPAGAFDTYGKAILDRNGYYRAMCAPQNMLEDMLEEMLEKNRGGVYPLWDPGIDGRVNVQKGFYMYNLQHIDSDTYEALFVAELVGPQNGAPGEFHKMYLAVQKLRVEKETGRWVVIPLEDFRYLEAISQDLAWGCAELPGMLYSGAAKDIKVEVRCQTVHTIDSTVTKHHALAFLSSTCFDTTPNPHAEFTRAAVTYATNCVYLGSEADRAAITQVGLSLAPVYPGEPRPTELFIPAGEYASGGSNTGEQWVSKKIEADWDGTVSEDGGSGSADPGKDIEYPEFFAADVYVNTQKIASLDLMPQEGAVE